MPPVPWFKYVDSIIQYDREMERDVSQRTQFGWMKWIKWNL